MTHSSALIEWESGGLEDVPTENITAFITLLDAELKSRGEPTKLDSIIEILKGIDQDEADSDDGWWQTSVGVKFGESILQKIKLLFT